MRRVFLLTIEGHPAATVGLYLYWKPRQILITFARLLAGISVGAWLLALLGALLMSGVFVASQRKSAPIERRAIQFLAIAAVLLSALPNLWAYAAYHTVADSLLSILILIVFSAWMMGIVLIERWRSRAITIAQKKL